MGRSWRSRKGARSSTSSTRKPGSSRSANAVTISDLSVSFHAHCSATQLTRAPAVRSTACCTRRWCTRTTTASSRERFARTTTPWMCWSQEPVLPGCFLRARAIGLMPMIDQVCIRHQTLHLQTSSRREKDKIDLLLGFLGQGEKDDKIIAVCTDDPEYRHYNDLSELSPHRVQEIRRFFEYCKLPQRPSIPLLFLLLHVTIPQNIQIRRTRTRRLLWTRFSLRALPAMPSSTPC